MARRLFDHDPLTGRNEFFHYDAEKDDFLIEQVEDVTDVVESARRRYNTFGKKAPWKGDVHHVAQIPHTVWAQLVKEGRHRDEAALKRWLDDPDQRAFRTRPGRLS